MSTVDVTPEELAELRLIKKQRDEINRLNEELERRDYEVESLKEELKEAKKGRDAKLNELRKLIADAKSGQQQLEFKEKPAKADDDSKLHWMSISIKELSVSKAVMESLREFGFTTIGEVSRAIDGETVAKCDGGLANHKWTERKIAKLKEAVDALRGPAESDEEPAIISMSVGKAAEVPVKILRGSQVVQTAGLKIGEIHPATIVGHTAEVATKDYGTITLLDGEWEFVEVEDGPENLQETEEYEDVSSEESRSVSAY